MIGRYEDAVAVKNILLPYLKRGSAKLIHFKDDGWCVYIEYNCSLKITADKLEELLDNLKHLLFIHFPKMQINGVDFQENYTSCYYRQADLSMLEKLSYGRKKYLTRHTSNAM